MTGLTDLQHQFQRYLLGDNADFISCIKGSRKVSAETRLGIYKNAYQLRLIDALASNYPILSKCLGHDQFNELGEAYLRSYPSVYRSIRWFGDHLPQFLCEHKPYKDMPYLAELAQFEWVMTLVFDAPDSTVLQIDDIAAVQPSDWSNMRFWAHPSLHCLDLAWNVVAVWQALSEDERPPEFAPNEIPVSWILWRKDFINQFCSIPEEEAYAIHAMLKGETFGELCEGVCQWVNEENAALHAASLLKGWVQSGLLSRVEISESLSED